MLPSVVKVLSDAVLAGPSMHDLAHLVAGFAPVMSLCVLFGIIVAVLFRRRIAIQIAGSVLVGFAYYAVLIWRSNDPDIWSWRDPFTSAIYQFVPAVCFCVIPAVAGALIVRGVQLWFHAKRI